MMKIYVAHNYSARAVLPAIIQSLERLGHKVTSRWITDDQHDEQNAETAQLDLDDIDRADAVLLFVDQFGARPGKGKYVELGYAIGTGKKCYLFGTDRTCIFYHLPQLVWITDIAEIKEQ